MIRPNRPARQVWAGVILLLLVGMAGMLPAVHADDPAEQTPVADAAAPKVLSLDEIEKRLTAAPWASRFAIITRIFAILAGIAILLVGLWLAFDRKRAGAAALTRPRTPPPALFPPGQAFLLAAVGFLVVPALIMAVLTEVKGAVSFQDSALALAVGGLPVAALVVVRRVRARRPSVGLPVAVLRGLEGFCVATVFVVPAGLVTLLILKAMGHEPAAQELVSMVLTTRDESVPWTLLVFGVLIAPFTEEAIFRGLLYPAIRDAGPAGRAGAWRAAILVSALFAIVHRSATAALGLFCLALVLTWIYERTNSLLAIVVAHSTNNLLSLVPLLLARYGI